MSISDHGTAFDYAERLIASRTGGPRGACDRQTPPFPFDQAALSPGDHRRCRRGVFQWRAAPHDLVRLHLHADPERPHGDGCRRARRDGSRRRDPAHRLQGYRPALRGPGRPRRRIRGGGAATYLEVVSLDRDSEIRSVKAAVELGVDYLLGGTRVDDVLPLLAGTASATTRSRDGSSAIRAGSKGRKARSSRVPSRSHRARASPVSTSWPTDRRSTSRRSSPRSAGRCRSGRRGGFGRQPGAGEADPAGRCRRLHDRDLRPRRSIPGRRPDTRSAASSDRNGGRMRTLSDAAVARAIRERARIRGRSARGGAGVGAGAAMTRPIRRRTQSSTDHGRQPPRRTCAVTARKGPERAASLSWMPRFGDPFGFLAGRSRNILPSRPMETAYSPGNDRAVFPI